MIVYGDHQRRITPRRLLADLTSSWSEATPLERHGKLVAALISAGQITQALADEDFNRHGCDRTTGETIAALGLALRLARSVARSWQTDFTNAAVVAPADVRAVQALPDLDRELTVREPEGFAHYAVYPEAYLTAAVERAPRDAKVIGIRSIGASLGAVVASALSQAPPVTVRPIGHPFARELALDPMMQQELSAWRGAFAIVDEGPGLSGSSFGAVADALERLGVEAARIMFFPSHGFDPGAQASAPHRLRWLSATRLVETFDDIALERPRRPAHRLERWAEDLTGSALAPLDDIAGGRWRAASKSPRADEPPADAAAERRKFLLRSEGGVFLLKFIGLGRSGVERFALHNRLAAAGFALRPSGLRHGFSVEPWRADLVPLALSGITRERLVDHLGRYLAFRADLDADGRSGASMAALLDMAIVNLREVIGAEAAAALESWRPHLAGLAAAARPVLTDNRLQAWEWLVTPDGQIVKTDAVDHHAGHDLIGCQDIAWDLAGAAVEWDLAPEEQQVLVERLSRLGRRTVDPHLLQFYRLAYRAFQIGACDLAAGRADAADHRRWMAQKDRYILGVQQEFA